MSVQKYPTCTNVNFFFQFLQKFFSPVEIREMKPGILDRILSHLMRHKPLDNGTNSYCARTVLERIPKASRKKFFHWINLKNESKTDDNPCSDIVETSEEKTLSDTFADKENRVPIVYLKDVLTTQGATSKSNFMNYFGLQKNDSPIETRNEQEVPHNHTKFSQALNVPISSDLGLLLASRENVSITEEFKLRKIDRYEWYVNKPYDTKEKVHYPVIYVDPDKVNNNRKLMNKGSNCMEVTEKISTTVPKFSKLPRVNIERVDLVNLRKKIQRNARRRARRRKVNQQKLLMKICKPIQVLIPNDERTIVDQYMRTKCRGYKKK